MAEKFSSAYPALSFLIKLISYLYMFLIVYSLYKSRNTPYWFNSILIVGLLLPFILYYYFTIPIVIQARSKLSQKKKQIKFLSKFKYYSLIIFTLLPFQLSTALELSSLTV
jgi:hypothetical protein